MADKNMINPDYIVNRAGGEEEIDPKYYLYIFLSKKWLILSIILLSFVGSSIYFFKQPDKGFVFPLK